MKAATVFFFALVLACSGHTDISTTIKELSAKIAAEPGAELYYQRATEYRALREHEHAIEDLRAALKLDPDHLLAQLSLIEALGDSDEALERALWLSTTPGNQAFPEGSYLLAGLYQKRGKPAKALKVIRRLDRLTRQNGTGNTAIDLRHAGILLDLKRPDEAAAVLKSAWERTKSIVIRNNWIDAALSAGKVGEVLPLIEKELRSSRFRSSWLIRRARALLVLDREAAARADLQAALLEINPRLNPARPDLTLVADRGLIHALLGQPDPAKRDLATLEQSSYPPTSYRLLREQLTGSE